MMKTQKMRCCTPTTVSIVNVLNNVLVVASFNYLQLEITQASNQMEIESRIIFISIQQLL